MSEVERPKSVVSQSSSIITLSSIPPGSKPTRSVKKVHTFGKREHSIKRDPNSPVVIRGWLYKQDSSGWKLWKRRWFVLSNFCMFYYQDSREETVLGSVSLPSYKVMPAEPKEVKNRKFAFKAEHLGMRTYYFSADTQEDMTGWVRAMNQCALVELTSNSKAPSLSDINCIRQDERYTSYEDFTHPGLMQNPKHAKSAESLEVTELSEKRGEMDFLEERVIGSEDTGRMIKKMPIFALSMEHCTPCAQNGAAPPPTPVNEVQDDSYHYERDSFEEAQEQCLLEVWEWVRLQKEKSALRKASRTGEAEQHQEKSLDGSEWPCPGSIRQDIVPSDYTNYCERPSCPTQTEAELSISRPVRVTRSSSLPPNPSEVSAYQLLKRPNTPDNRMQTQSANENAIRYVQEETPKQRPLASPHSPVEKKRTQSQRASGQISRKGQKSQASLERHELDSSEDLSVFGSFRPVSRSLIRPHTPVGRVDIHPIEVTSVGYTLDSKHQEDKHNEHLISTIRSKTSLVGPASRPQTPSDRYGVLPFVDTVWPPPHVKHLNNLNKQTVKSPQPGPVDERYIDESSMTLPCRAYGTSGRSHGRASAPIERRGVSPPVDRLAESCQTTPSLGQHRNQAAKHLSLYQERCYTPQPSYTSRSSTPRLQGKLSTHSSSAAYGQLPPLPPLASRFSTPGQSVKRLSLSVTPTSEIYRERLQQPVRLTESDADVLLTRLCGQDKFLQSLTAEATELKADKERLESALEMTRMQMEEFKDQPAVSEKITCQQRFLKEDMITIRAKLCNLSMEIERAWNDYMRLETELLVHKASLERIQHSGLPQEQSEAQRQLWMVEDIMSGLTASKNNLQMAVESARSPVLTAVPPPSLERLPSVQSNLLYLSAPESPTQQQQPMADNELPKDTEAVPPRPPLPKDPTPATEDEAALDGNGKSVQAEGKTLSSKKPVEEKEGKGMMNANSRPHIGNGTDTLSRKTRMSAEEQLERIRKHQQAQIYERIKSVTLGQRRTPEPQQGSARHQASNKCKSMDVSSCHAENVNRQKGMTGNLPSSSKVAPSCEPAATLISASDLSCKSAANEESSTMERAGSPAHAEMAKLPLIRQTVQSEQQGDTKDMGVYSVSSTTVSPLCSVTTISLKQISVPVTGLASPVRTTNKLLTARPSPQTLEDAGEQHSHAEDMAKVKVNKMVATGRYMEFDPNVTLTADELDAKQKKVEKIKTMVAQTSPGAAAGSCTWHSASGDIYTQERERDRIINLSYILATEASQRSKLITGRIFSDLPPHEDDIHSSSGSEWEPVLQDVHSDGQEEKDRGSTSCDSQEDNSPEYHADQLFMLPSEIPDNLYSSVSNTVLSRETVSEKLTVTEMQETATQDFLNNNQLASRHPQQSGKCSRSSLACDCGVKELTVTGDLSSFGLESNKEVASLVEEYIQRDKEPVRITVLQSSL